MSANLNPVLQKTLALGILLLVILFVWFLLVQPIWSAWSERSSEAAREEELVIRLHKVVAEIPSLRAQSEILSRSQQDQAVSFTAANANLAAVQLQAEVKRIAAAVGAVVQSIQQLPAVPENGLDRIGVRAEFQGDTAQIAQVLRDLGAHTPKLFIYTMSVQGNEQQAISLTAPSPLFVQIEVTAYSRTGG